MTRLDQWIDHARGMTLVLRVVSEPDELPEAPLDQLAAEMEIDLDRETLRAMAFTLGALGRAQAIRLPGVEPGTPAYNEALPATCGWLLEAVALRLDLERDH